MKIYRLTVNQVDSDPLVCISSYSAPRHVKNVEFYLSREKAELRQTELYEGMQKLLGFVPKVEAIISEIEVIE